MLFREKLPYQYNPHERDLLNVAADIIRFVEPDDSTLAGKQFQLRLDAEQAFKLLLETNSEEGDGHLRLLQQKAILSTNLSEYYFHQVQASDRQVDFNVDCIIDLKLYSQNLLSMLTETQDSIFMCRSEPKVFSGKGRWSDTCTITLHINSANEIQIDFMENNANCTLKGSHFAALISKVSSDPNQEIVEGQSTIKLAGNDKKLKYWYRIHDVGNHQFVFSQRFADLHSAESFLTKIFASIKETSRDQLLVASSTQVNFVDQMKSEATPLIVVPDCFYFESLALRVHERQDNVLFASVEFTEQHLAKLVQSGEVKAKNFRRNYFSDQAIPKLVQTIQDNNINSLIVSADNYLQLTGQPSYSEFKNWDLDIINALVAAKPTFSISVSNPKDTSSSVIQLC